MFLIRPFVVVFLFLLAFPASSQSPNNHYLVLNYHDIVESQDPTDSIAVSIKNFVDHLDWLKSHHYTIISTQQLLDAAAGGKPLPEKAVMLTFDDGYKNFYQYVFPLLKKYKYPATLALVGAWMDGDNAQSNRPSQALMTWPEVREVVASGLVEIASHSDDLHHGVTANPQGNEQAAVSTRIYDNEYDEYEKDDAYRQRLFQHIGKSADFIFQNLAVRPRVMVWPYGEYNAIAVDAAKMAGLGITMNLEDGSNTLADINTIKRIMIYGNPNIHEFAELMSKQRLSRQLRVAHVDLDYIYDADEKQTEANLAREVERILHSGANTVYLQAYADPDGDGNADALYFPNRHLPVRRDLFNRVAWQFKSIAKMKVYAWLPILAYQGNIPAKWYVKEWRDGKAQVPQHIYTRLSPFNPEARQFISEIYEDLAKYCSFDGLLFHDDGILSDFEDASDLAMNFTHDVWGLPADVASIQKSPELRLRWGQHKTALLAEFTDSLTDKVRYYRPGIKTARNFYALPLLEPQSEEWFAQSFPVFLAHYDYVAVEAMPFMEKASNPEQWLKQLVAKTAQYPDGLKKMVFELQTTDWEKKQKIPMDTFISQLELLKKLGAKHIGYYPDDFFNDQPELKRLQPAFSVIVTDN